MFFVFYTLIPRGHVESFRAYPSVISWQTEVTNRYDYLSCLLLSQTSKRVAKM